MTRLNWLITLENLVGENASFSNWTAFFWRKKRHHEAPTLKKMHVIHHRDEPAKSYKPGDVLQNKFNKERVRVTSYSARRQQYEVTYVDSGSHGYYTARKLEDEYTKVSSNHVSPRQQDLRDTMWKNQLTKNTIIIESLPNSDGRIFVNTNSGHISMNVDDLNDDWQEIKRI
jgi:hypothetical protein